MNTFWQMCFDVNWRGISVIAEGADDSLLCYWLDGRGHSRLLDILFFHDFTWPKYLSMDPVTWGYVWQFLRRVWVLLYIHTFLIRILPALNHISLRTLIRTEWNAEKYCIMGGLVWNSVTFPSVTQQLSFWLANAAPAVVVPSSWASDWSELPQKLIFWLVGEVQVKW